MKKLSQYILSIMLSLFIIPFGNVHAESLDVQTINASITDNKISVDGTVDNGVLAVAIMVYEEDGTTLVKMETTSVDSNDKYSDTIVVTAGKKYIVKAANYNGGTYVTTEVETPTPSTNKPTPSVDKPTPSVDKPTPSAQTGDNSHFVAYSAIMIMAATGYVFLNKKENV